MQLLGNGSQGGDNSGLVIALAVLAGIAYLAYHAFIFFCRPALYAEMRRQKHEREMAAAAERRAAAGKATGNILSGIAKAAVALAMKKKH